MQGRGQLDVSLLSSKQLLVVLTVPSHPLLTAERKCSHWGPSICVTSRLINLQSGREGLLSLRCPESRPPCHWQYIKEAHLGQSSEACCDWSVYGQCKTRQANTGAFPVRHDHIQNKSTNCQIAISDIYCESFLRKWSVVACLAWLWSSHDSSSVMQDTCSYKSAVMYGPFFSWKLMLLLLHSTFYSRVITHENKMVILTNF